MYVGVPLWRFRVEQKVGVVGVVGVVVPCSLANIGAGLGVGLKGGMGNMETGNEEMRK